MAELKFTQQQDMLRKAVREFVEKEVKPVAARLDTGNPASRWILFAKMGKLGFSGVFVPQQYGGAGLRDDGARDHPRGTGTPRGGAGDGVDNHHLGVELDPVVRDGGAEEQITPDLASGRKSQGLAVTEPPAGPTR